MNPMQYEPSPAFKAKFDRIVLENLDDAEFMGMIEILDLTAQELGISVYQVLFYSLYKEDQEKRARRWLADKLNGQA